MVTCHDLTVGLHFNSMSMAMLSSPTRSSPSALHSASVHITEVSDFSNPHPQESGNSRRSSLDSVTEDVRTGITQDYLTPLKLMQLSQEPDLSRVTFLELSVNTTENSLGNFGKGSGFHT